MRNSSRTARGIVAATPGLVWAPFPLGGTYQGLRTFDGDSARDRFGFSVCTDCPVSFLGNPDSGQPPYASPPILRVPIPEPVAMKHWDAMEWRARARSSSRRGGAACVTR